MNTNSATARRFTCHVCRVIFVARDPERDLCHCEPFPQGHPRGWEAVITTTGYRCLDCGTVHNAKQRTAWYCPACRHLAPREGGDHL